MPEVPPDSTETAEYTRRLQVGESDYQPNEEVSRALQNKVFVGIIGPIAVGKSTVITEVEKLDPTFREISGLTTRDKRPDDIPHTFRKYLPHTPASLKELLAKQTRGELVQHTVHRQTGFVYASELEDYPAEYCITPILSSNVANTAQLPFRDTRFVSLICRSSEWFRRFNDREKDMTRADISKRLVEACVSLEWSLENKDTVWVRNKDDKQRSAAAHIIAYAKTGEPPENNTASRKVAENLLGEIRLQK